MTYKGSINGIKPSVLVKSLPHYCGRNSEIKLDLLMLFWQRVPKIVLFYGFLEL